MPVPSDIYKQDVDFSVLAIQYPEFAKKLKNNSQLDFSDPESIRQLTKALLHRDFDIVIDLPEDRLCPPVPNRFNYIVFIQKLLDSTQPNFSEDGDEDENLDRLVIGLDIGTGASAIYPLLACRQRPSWHFLATEIDEKSKRYAEHNIEHNGLLPKIKLLNTVQSGKPLIPSKELNKIEHVDILITNPPFYSSEAEMISLADQKSFPPNSACTGSPVEMITPGGEVTFVFELIEESRSDAMKRKIQWFSSMLGKLRSVSTIVTRLREVGCTNYAVTEFVQGQKTRRWCVAWSWYSPRPPSTIARGTEALEKKLLAFPTRFTFDVQPENTVILATRIDEAMTSLKIQWHWQNNTNIGIGYSLHGDVWSRHARRKHKRDNQDGSDDAMDATKTMLKFKIQLNPTTEPGRTRVVMDWLQGHDSVLFESLCGWLKRKVMATSTISH